MPGVHFTSAEVDELSRVYRDRVSAGRLLLRAGFHRGKIPMNVANALEYWRQVDEHLQEGQRQSILTNAVRDYPVNDVLRSFLEG